MAMESVKRMKTVRDPSYVETKIVGMTAVIIQN